MLTTGAVESEAGLYLVAPQARHFWAVWIILFDTPESIQAGLAPSRVFFTRLDLCCGKTLQMLPGPTRAETGSRVPYSGSSQVSDKA